MRVGTLWWVGALVRMADMGSERTDYIGLLSTFEYRRDIRNPYPGAANLRAFLLGWKHAVENRVYGSSVQKTLTWQNLGNRLGNLLGPVSPAEQERAFDVLLLGLKAKRTLKDP